MPRRTRSSVAGCHGCTGRPRRRLRRNRRWPCAPREARTHDTMGVIFSRGGRHERAVACFERAAALAPGNAGFQFNLASSLKFLGRFDAAEAAYEACLAADPHYWRAHSALVAAAPADAGAEPPRAPAGAAGRRRPRRSTPSCTCVMRWRRNWRTSGDTTRRSTPRWPAGRASARRSGITFARDAALFEAAARAFPSPLPPDDRAPRRRRRSSSWVCRAPARRWWSAILSSHTQVASAGESQNFGVLLKRAAGTRRRPCSIPRRSRARSTSTWAPSVASTSSVRGPPGDQPRFVDKLPLNFFYLGHIAQALPGARIVVLRRHPLDTVVANFPPAVRDDHAVLRIRVRPARHRALLARIRRAHRALAPGAARPAARGAIRGAGRRPANATIAGCSRTAGWTGSRPASRSNETRLRWRPRAPSRCGSRCTRRASGAGDATRHTWRRRSRSCAQVEKT